MEKIVIEGQVPLKGKVRCEGAKNAALPIMAATMLCEEPCILSGVPPLKDVESMSRVLCSLGLDVTMEDGTISVRQRGPLGLEPPYEAVRAMRASFLVLGPLLCRLGAARIPLPGGCDIGQRPVDLHLKGLQAMGASIELKGGYVEAKARRLAGATIYLDFPSVGATENLMMAASQAAGETVIENAAQEPEVVDLANFLNAIGANIRGAGTSRVRITGRRGFGGCEYTIIPDRLEAATYLLAGISTGGSIRVDNVIPEHLTAFLAKIQEAGAEVSTGLRYVTASMEGRPNPVNVKTLPYPGFPTDLQAPVMSFLTTARGTSMIIEGVFERRFAHVEELNRMGAKIRAEGSHAVVEGVEELTGASVEAPDLRAGAALVLAGLQARGRTEVAGVSHIKRGYYQLVEKLKGVGARIELVQSEENP